MTLAADPRAQDTTPWREIVSGYQQPTLAKSLGQLATSVLPFIACWALAYRLYDASRVASLAASMLAAGFLLRLYIIQHDCGHASFFESVTANHVAGSLLSAITIIPYFQWRHNHAVHHATSGNLARRGVGDVWVMTIGEYIAATPRQRLGYRIYRNPFVLFGLAPLGLFLVLFRLTSRDDGRRERIGVYALNATMIAVGFAFYRYASFAKFIGVEGPIVWAGATISVWLFYMQHQFEETSWSHGDDWDFATGALEGASLYQLPSVLQWFSGNIGIHHVHHLSPKIPNYELQRCMDDNPLFQSPTVIPFWAGFRCAALRIWDEDSRRLVGWREADAIIRRRQSPDRAPSPSIRESSRGQA